MLVHIGPTIVHLTIDGETIKTTPKHPFYVMDSALPALSIVEGWLAIGATQGRWVDAGDLHVGDAVRQADGTTGIVQVVVASELLFCRRLRYTSVVEKITLMVA